jgi:glycosyltransferase involved in cell wall biosynthesis
MKDKPIICHVTSAHPEGDIRVYHKMCVSMTDEFKIVLIIPNAISRSKDNVEIIGFNTQFKSRFDRIKNAPKKIMKLALSVSADIYQLHDPELLRIAILLKQKSGAKVIFDSHEDVPKQISNKTWIPSIMRSIVSRLYSNYEKNVCKKIDGVISVTPIICNRFRKINPNTEMIANYPNIVKFQKAEGVLKIKNAICYIGGLSQNRGILELVKSLEYCNAELHLAGRFETKKLELQAKSLKGWSQVKYYGHVSREKISEIMALSNIGMVTLHPTPSYREAYPIKLFEYMSAQIAVLASDFPLYRELIENYNCGYFVDPFNVEAIGKIIQDMLNDPGLTKKQGLNGYQAVLKEYNWSNEKKKLTLFYEKTLQSN